VNGYDTARTIHNIRQPSPAKMSPFLFHSRVLAEERDVESIETAAGYPQAYWTRAVNESNGDR